MKKIMFNDRYGLTEAVLSGRKTQTRRICKDQHWSFSELVNANQNDNFLYEKPKYRIGEVVAVAQSYREIAHINDNFLDNRYEVKEEYVAGWANKLFVRADLMPHQIRITNVRVERLQDISDEDCIKELGLKHVDSDMGYKKYQTHMVYQFLWDDNLGRTREYSHESPKEVFALMIDKICGFGTWDSNPYVFAYEFELVKKWKGEMDNI